METMQCNHDAVRKSHFEKINRRRKRWKSFNEYMSEMTNKLLVRCPYFNQNREDVYNGMVKHYSMSRHDYSKNQLEQVIQGIVKDHFIEKEVVLTRLVLESE